MNELSVTVLPEQRELVVVQGSSKETYSLQTIPSKLSQLVVNSKQEILHELHLSDIVLNLDNAAGLMYVAYNALAGTQIQSKMSGLQSALLDLCKDCIVTVQAFDIKSSEILTYLVQTYKWLFKGQEALALKQLERCGECAGEMAKKSEELAAGFTAIAKTTEAVLEASQDEENLQYQKMNELQAKLRKIEADKAAKGVLQKELIVGIEEMRTLYTEAKELEKIESERAFVLGLTSAISSAVGKGLGAAVSIYNPASKITAVTNALKPTNNTLKKKESTKTKDQKTKEAKQAEEDAKAIEKEIDEKNAAVKKLEGQIKTLTQEVQTAEQEAKTKEKEAKQQKEKAEGTSDDKPKTKARRTEEAKALAKVAAKARKLADDKKTQLKTKQEELKALQAKIKSTKEKAKAKRAIAASLAEVLSGVSDGTAKMQEAAASYAQSAHEEKMQYLNQKLELEKQNREVLAALAEYAQLIKNTDFESNTAAVAVETLHVAVRCLKQIVTSLATAALFWRSMEQYCQNLAKSKLAEQIQDIQALPLEVRLAEYLEPEFMFNAVAYMARWVALNTVCKDYWQAVNKAYGKVKENINSAPKIEEAKKMAPKLADEILTSVNSQLQVLDLTTKELKAEQQLLEQGQPSAG
jgi:chemotaxis protein histidine kinase CheA